MEQVARRIDAKARDTPRPEPSANSGTTLLARPKDNAIVRPPLTAAHERVSDSMLLPTSVSMSPFLSPLRDEMFVSYTIENLCEEPLGLVYAQFLPFNLTSSHPQQAMVSHCLLAMAKIFYGLRTREARVLHSGIHLYGQGLRMVNTMLDKCHGSVTTEMLVSVISLCVGEGMMPSSKQSWTVHVLGLEHLFALRGPLTAENSSILERALLESFRAIMILGALFTGRPSLMSNEAWRATTVPRDSTARPELFRTSTATPVVSFLLSLLAQLPWLVLERDKWLRRVEAGESPHALGNAVWVRFVQLWHDAKIWKEKWDLHYQKSVYEVTPSPQVGSTGGGFLTAGFGFTNIEVAEAFVMYQMVIILLAGIALPLFTTSVHLSLPNHVGSDGLSESSLISDVGTSAMNICRSVEGHLQLRQSSQRQPDFYLLFPMHVARRAFKALGCSAELAWLSGLFEMVLSKATMGIWIDMDISDKVVGAYVGQFGKGSSTFAGTS